MPSIELPMILRRDEYQSWSQCLMQDCNFRGKYLSGIAQPKIPLMNLITAVGITSDGEQTRIFDGMLDTLNDWLNNSYWHPDLAY